MEKMQYESFKKDYENKKITLSINLSKAREILLMEINYKPIIFFHIFIYILLLGCCIYSFFIFKWFGILYSIIFIALWFLYMGACSVSKKTSKGITTICIGIIFTLLTGIIFDFYIALLIGLTFLELYLTNCLYQFSAKILIDKFVLKDEKYFSRWYNEVFFIV